MSSLVSSISETNLDDSLTWCAPEYVEHFRSIVFGRKFLRIKNCYHHIQRVSVSLYFFVLDWYLGLNLD